MAKPKAGKHISDFQKCAAIVAHPDDETIWAGGTILLHPEAKWTIVTLCRKSDNERFTKFYKALEQLNATGNMADMDDSTEQNPLRITEIEDTIDGLLPPERFDLVLTHGLWGEYTRHLRHEETGKAVMALWESERLSAGQIWRFAYDDDQGKHPPLPLPDADRVIRLPEEIWKKKYQIVTDVYGFETDSFEAKAASREEAFWIFTRDKKQ